MYKLIPNIRKFPEYNAAYEQHRIENPTDTDILVEKFVGRCREHSRCDVVGLAAVGVAVLCHHDKCLVALRGEFYFDLRLTLVRDALRCGHELTLAEILVL